MVKLWAQAHPEEGRIIPDEWKNYGSIYGKSDHERMKEKLAELRETLPTRFSSWVEFYNLVKDSMDKYDGKIDVISWSEYIPGDMIYNPGEENPNAQEFKVDFIKARCFDEIMLLYPEVSYPGGPYEDELSSFYVVRKIDDIMGYKRGGIYN